MNKPKPKKDPLYAYNKKRGDDLHKQWMALSDTISDLMKDPSSQERYEKVREAMEARKIIDARQDERFRFMEAYSKPKIKEIYKLLASYEDES